jgi:hypothetical protein
MANLERGYTCTTTYNLYKTMQKINHNLEFPVSIYTGAFHLVFSQEVSYIYLKYHGSIIIYTTIKVRKIMG